MRLIYSRVGGGDLEESKEVQEGDFDDVSRPWWKKLLRNF